LSQPHPLAANGSVCGLTVFMRGLTVEAEIGLYAHERGRRQPLLVEIEAGLHPHAVEGLADTLNYELLAANARAVAAEGHIDLVETYVQALASRCLEHPQVRRVRVRVEKPEALQGAVAGVELIAER
jgi:7,8-dihydroneopterin aldolase/epimerase/oxygenase